MVYPYGMIPFPMVWDDMNDDTVIGVKLIGGPPHFDGWSNAYDAHKLNGWPPPDELAVLSIGGTVVVALPDSVPGDFVKDVSIYRKVRQSVLPEAGEHIFRGATYEYVK